MAWTAPKTDFAPGNVLTAAQMNAIGNNLLYLPRGVIVTSTSTTADTTTSAKDILSVTFTAEASRKYKVDIIGLFSHSGSAQCAFSIKNGASELQRAQGLMDANPRTLICTYYGTFTAGSVTLKGNMTTFGGGTLSVLGASTYPQQIVVQDLGQ